MNKLTFIVVFATIAVATAEPLPGSGPSLDDIVEDVSEKSVASGEQVTPVVGIKEFSLFEDYCTQSSDVLKTFLRDQMNGASATIYSILFASFHDVSNAVLEQQAEAIAQGTRMIETQSTLAPAAADRWSLYYSVKNAAKHVYNTVIETASSQALAKLAALKDLYSKNTLISSIDSVCYRISNELIRRLNDSLAATLSEIKRTKSKAPDAEEILGIISRAKIDTIGCQLTTRVSYAAKFCDILRIASTNIYSALYSTPGPAPLDE